ncbi:MAG: DUF4825 domain-containing protein [Ignavibacteria bacterium]|jgi:hypothetical protein
MKKIIVAVAILISVTFAVLRISKRQSVEKNVINKLMEYNDSYVGNASAVGNILTLLEVDRDHFSLNTSERPYGINVYCRKEVHKDTAEVKHLYASTVIFTLIKNVDEIRFKYNDDTDLFITRNMINDFFGVEVVAYGKNKEKWQSEILNKLNSEKVVEEFYSNQLREMKKR